jgi:hypothetical protein
MRFLIAHRIDTLWSRLTKVVSRVIATTAQCTRGALQLAARRLEPTSTLPALTLLTLDTVGLLRKY